jgi:predicted MFS family arabinose efflux permease
MQAYLGDRIPFQRRGRTLALTEMSWSLSFIILVPLAGLLIAHWGWVAPFWLLTGLGLLMLAMVVWRVPADRPHPAEQQPALWHGLKQVFTSPPALVALSFSLLITLGNEVVNLVFGAWIEDAFHLQIAALGLAATLIGLAELGGESATAALVDRIGKIRAVRAGVIFTSLAALSLPVLGRSLGGALFALVLFYLGFEFTLVSYIPVMTEVYPQARATLMAANLAAFSLGRAFGALLGPWLFASGIGWNAIAALVFNGLALLILRWVKIPEGKVSR